MIHGLLHAGLLVADTSRALAFYHGVLGLAVDASRPDLGYPGAWLRAGVQQVHLMELPGAGPRPDQPAHGGRDRHLAFALTDLEMLRRRLDEAGVSYTMSRSGRRALFCRDPDGNALEFVERA